MAMHNTSSANETKLGLSTPCTQCRLDVYPVVVWCSGLVDWETADGDSGCEFSPDTNEDGTGSHAVADGMEVDAR